MQWGPRFILTFTAKTHSIVFLSDNLRNTLREVIRENGLSPDKLMQDWSTIERGIRRLARFWAFEQTSSSNSLSLVLR